MNRFEVALTSFEKSSVFMNVYKQYVALFPTLKKLFLPMWIAVVAFGALGTAVYYVEPRTYVEIWFEVGRKLGSLSALFYIATLIPGILKRFNVLPLTRAAFRLPRRQFGVTMFIFAFVHQWLVRSIPVVLETGSFLPINNHVLAGMISITLLFPLWLTSNDYSVKKLGKWWDYIHSLTYVAMFAILLHVALISERTLATLLFITILLEIGSWIYSRTPKKQSPSITA